MPHELELLQEQMNRLEHQLRWFKIAAVVLAVLAIAFALAPRTSAQPPDSIRVRQLIVEDAEKRPRIVLGPLDAGKSLRTGLRINDPNGVERFGVAFMDDGNLVVGLDAPPGTGNDANRERITLVTDPKGGAYIRFLDRRTSVVSRMYLDEQNRAWLSFSDFTQKPAMIRRYGLTGEETLRPPTQ